MAALLAEQGFTAGDATLEGPQGFFEVYNGAGNYEVDRLLTDGLTYRRLLTRASASTVSVVEHSRCDLRSV